jgi:hypothetical protein
MGDIDWSDLVQNRDMRWAFVNSVMKLYVPLSVGYFLTRSGPVTFSGRTLLHGVSEIVS